ncbi:MAG: polysaccharide biosynthesis protein [Pseudoflavonifractor capillosus]|uniref:putative polysaccharide biosynthesis protein n=1 Tax=Pseudoflavonifractor capillosus TaxID=106588 RepID=UPI0023F997CE|nr:polysaccharide biosynthesis protein [Pseudoflavonifractor capillosus]MCI5927107.1 polysaccharide biosynthesis protein [Pseudoflavonifractor capillosus]MDY4661879.1 polysaccharide biosynthesis protein [Pseudoflavonifractor capillosus]
MSNAEKKSTFFGGAAILAASAILVKVIGAIYRIPLGNILSDEVMADYNSAYNIYNFFLTISTAGLPVALSKTISEANALGRHNQVQRTFRVAFITFLILGLISFFCMTVLAAPMAQIVISNPKAVYCVMALAPSVLCVCIMSAFRGYFQGHFNMMPTGISQVIEAFFKLVVGLALALFLVNVIQKPELGSVGAIIGVSCGSVVALLYILYLFFRDRKRRQRIHATDRPDGSMRILSNLLKLAIPITLGSAATSLVTLIDTKLVMSQLQSVYQTVDGLGKEAALDAARGLYGIYSKTMSIYNLPFSMMVPLTACIIPAVSASLARRDHLGAQKVSESALRIGLLLALPMGMGLFALGGPIMGLLFPTIDVEVAGPLLSVLGLASIFVALQLLCNSILQANGMVNLPILAVVIGGVVKVVVNFILVGNPNIRINGAPVGTLTCFIVISALEIFIIRRSIPAPPSFLRAFLKPFVPSVIMAAAAWATYGLLTNFLHMGNSLATIGGIGVGVVVYLVLVLALRVLSREDLELMPKGDKIAKILHIK